VRQHRLDRPLGRLERLVRLVHDPVAAQLNIDDIALFQVHDLVGDARERHGIAGQEVLAAFLAHAQDQR